MIKVINEHETLDKLLRDKCSIVRYGDGEFKLCLGRSAKHQEWTKEIQRRLKNILLSKNDSVLVGIPNIWEVELPPTKELFWSKYRSKEYVELLNPNKIYYSSFITRPDCANIFKNSYFEKMKMLWRDKDVLLIQGKGKDFNEHRLIQDIKSLEVIVGPEIHAFSKHDWYHKTIENITNKFRSYAKNLVIIVSLGPAATVLAYDLGIAGFQSLDLGSIGMFYDNPEKVKEKLRGESFPN